MIAGGCLCGAIRYETEAQPINIRACHCRICQKATGAPYYARVMAPLDQVKVMGDVGWFASSSDVRRGFCRNCGTTLFTERAASNAMGLTMGSLDEPARFAPTDHIWLSSKQPWVEIEPQAKLHPFGV